MIPSWVAVLSALSLALIALAGLTIAAQIHVAGRHMLRLLATFEAQAGPALQDIQRLVAAIRTEAEAITGTSRDLRERIVRAADAAQERLADLGALLDVIQDEVEGATVDFAATVRTIRRGASVLSLGELLLPSRRKKKRKKK
ncbi:MAG TPA: hypothetical protein VNH63_13000 [Gemmatimonadales bacterium]|nr:hypothetical protein [Gemmatimonadales bacterium]